MRRCVTVLALALAGCGPRDMGPADPALAAFIPDEAVVLAGVRLEQIRTTPAGKQLAEAGWLEPPGVEARDVLASWDGKHWLVAARGSLRGPSGPELAQVGEFVLAGPAPAVKAAMKRQAAGGRPPRALIDRARTVPHGSQIWAVSYGAPGLPPGEGGRLNAVQRLLNAMEDITFSADLRTGLDAAASGACRDERNARVVEETVRGMVSLGRMALGKRDPDLQRALEGISVEREGRAVRMRATAPEEAAGKLVLSLIPR